MEAHCSVSSPSEWARRWRMKSVRLLDFLLESQSACGLDSASLSRHYQWVQWDSLMTLKATKFSSVSRIFNWRLLAVWASQRHQKHSSNKCHAGTRVSSHWSIAGGSNINLFRYFYLFKLSYLYTVAIGFIVTFVIGCGASRLVKALKNEETDEVLHVDEIKNVTNYDLFFPPIAKSLRRRDARREKLISNSNNQTNVSEANEHQLTIIFYGILRFQIELASSKQ